MSENEVLFVRSSQKNGNKSTEGDSSTNDEDIWDDTVLIQAYDKAVQLAQQSCLKKKQLSQGGINSNGKKKWKVGDKCRCQYSEDLEYYEAEIIEMLDSTGMCVVKYVGYENEEKVSLKTLKPSEGEVARTRQCQEAVFENANEKMEIESSTGNNSGRKPKPASKKSLKKKERRSKNLNGCSDKTKSFFTSLNFPLPHLGDAIIPPPPPHMFSGLNDDANENEAMSAMLISWYMSGYHTGFYQGLKTAKKE